MKRRYIGCDRCSELIYNENYSNQEYDNLCGNCHGTIYDICIECNTYVLNQESDLEQEDEEEVRCRALVHCTCEYCDVRVCTKCIGCHDDVIKERDDLTFAIIDVCYPCLMTRCIGCYETDTRYSTSILCDTCIRSNTIFQLIHQHIKIFDISKYVISYLIPSRSVVIEHPNHFNISGKKLLPLSLLEV